MKRRINLSTISTGRVAQHIVFWVVVYLLFTIIYSLKTNYSIAAHNNLFYIPVHVAYFYTIAYWLIPKYLLNMQYLKFTLGLFVMAFGTALVARLIDIWIVDPYLMKNIPDVDWTYIEESKRNFWQKLATPLNFFNAAKTVNLAVWVAVGFKMFKLWYERKQAALQAELNALKGQIHPHFLFNTLNNLYGLTLNNSPKAPGVVLGLSDMLRYMLYECNADTVSLKKEVLMLQHYIALEKIRYEDRLDLNFAINGDLDDKLIAPLMLLPLVENAFKHGTSEKAGDAWININLEVDCNRLKFKVSNSKAEYVGGDAEVHHGHIGLQNIKKRLEMLYPSNYQLKIMDEDDVFLAVLELELSVNGQAAKQLIPA